MRFIRPYTNAIFHFWNLLKLVWILIWMTTIFRSKTRLQFFLRRLESNVSKMYPHVDKIHTNCSKCILGSKSNRGMVCTTISSIKYERSCQTRSSIYNGTNGQPVWSLEVLQMLPNPSPHLILSLFLHVQDQLYHHIFSSCIKSLSGISTKPSPSRILNSITIIELYIDSLTTS